MYLVPFQINNEDPDQYALPIKGELEAVSGNTNDELGDMNMDPVIITLPETSITAVDPLYDMFLLVKVPVYPLTYQRSTKF